MPHAFQATRSTPQTNSEAIACAEGRRVGTALAARSGLRDCTTPARWSGPIEFNGALRNRPIKNALKMIVPRDDRAGRLRHDINFIYFIIDISHLHLHRHEYYPRDGPARMRDDPSPTTFRGTHGLQQTPGGLPRRAQCVHRERPWHDLRAARREFEVALAAKLTHTTHNLQTACSARTAVPSPGMIQSIIIIIIIVRMVAVVHPVVHHVTRLQV